MNGTNKIRIVDCDEPYKALITYLTSAWRNILGHRASQFQIKDAPINKLEYVSWNQSSNSERILLRVGNVVPRYDAI